MESVTLFELRQSIDESAPVLQWVRDRMLGRCKARSPREGPPRGRRDNDMVPRPAKGAYRSQGGTLLTVGYQDSRHYRRTKPASLRVNPRRETLLEMFTLGTTYQSR